MTPNGVLSRRHSFPTLNTIIIREAPAKVYFMRDTFAVQG